MTASAETFSALGAPRNVLGAGVIYHCMIRGKIREILKQAAGTDSSFSLETPPRPEFGDYATNLPMVIAKKTKENPMAVGERLRGQISDSLISGTSVSAPGFLNIKLADSVWREVIKKILKEEDVFGNSVKEPEKIQVEFISANPTGPLTLANGRGGFLGDVLSNVLVSQGHAVEREYYINDAGNQIRTLGLAVLAAGGLVAISEDYYRGDHVTAWAAAHADALEALRDKPEELGRLVAKDFLKNLIRVSIEKKMKVSFDRWTSEYENLHQKGFVKKAMEVFEKRGLLYQADEATWLRTTRFGDDKDRVVITGDGFPTYLAADAGHYLETKERGFQKKILILGADHHGYVPRLQAVAKIAGLAKSDVIVMQLVRLTRDGQEVRMSKRKGVYITIDELIDEVGVDAARYFFLEKNPETHVDFDLDLAKKQSKENPVYYIQYAHARLASLFRKGVAAPSDFDIADLKEESERELLKKLAQFPDVLEDIEADYRVARLVRYAYELAHAFHLFYEKHRVLEAEGGVRIARFALVSAASVVLKKTLRLLGISAPSEM